MILIKAKACPGYWWCSGASCAWKTWSMVLFNYW